MFSANDIPKLLELIDRPAFCVLDGVIRFANRAALARQVPVGTCIGSLLDSSAQAEYDALQDGCLYLTITIGDILWGASVNKIGSLPLFLLDAEEEDPALRAYALAAKALREPLNEALAIADGLAADPRTSRLNRSLYQLLRLVGNMSWSTSSAPSMEMRDVTAVMQELFEHAASLCAHAQIRLDFTNHPVPVYSIVDSDLLERGIYSILSNAMKYAGPGGVVDARLTRRGNTLYLTILDSGLSDDPVEDAFDRFRREPCIEDGRHGIGLGLMLARSVATAHRGTLLLDKPDGQGTRVILGLPIRQQGGLRSPVRSIDYAGERNRLLIELSEVLPAELYSGEI